MSNYGTQGLTQAQNWALQRKEAMERAKKLRDDRKYGLAMTGEMALNKYGHHDKVSGSNGLTNTTKPTRSNNTADKSTVNSRNPGYKKANTMAFDSRPIDDDLGISEQDLNKAKNSLRLLKSKMQGSGQYSAQSTNGSDSLTNAVDEYTRGEQERGLGSRENRNREDRFDQQRVSNEIQSKNQNYRKVFKPNMYGEEDSGRHQNALRESNRQQPQDIPYGEKPNSRSSQGYSLREEDDDYIKPSSQNNQSRIPKNMASSNRAKQPNYGISEFRMEDEPLVDKRQSGVRKEKQAYNSNPYNDENDYHEERAFSRQEYQPKQQKSYDPSNYAGQQPAKKGLGKENINYGDNYGDRSYQPPLQSKKQSYDEPKYEDRPNSRQIAPRGGNPYQDDVDSYSQPIYDDRPSRKSRTIDMDPADMNSDATGSLINCPQGCGRKFFENVLEKHAKVCVKVFQSKRRKFDMAEKRIVDEQQQQQKKTPFEMKKQSSKMAQSKKPNDAISVKQSKWKQQSGAFRANLKAARGAKLSQEEEVAVTKAQQEEFTQCEHCFRKFSEAAAQRHIPFCKNKQKMDSLKKGGSKPKPVKKF